MQNVFKQQLITLRRRKQLSQTALARKLYVSRQSISKWENGDAEPGIDKLVALAEIFGVTLDFLILDTEKPTDVILKIRNLKKAFTTPVLRGINLNLYGRERIALLGSNGAGKSTLAKIIYGKLKPDSGQIESFISNKDDLRVMPQENILIEDLKLAEHVQLTARLNKVYSPAFVTQMIKKFKLDKQSATSVSKLSGGQKRKLALLLSLLKPSKLLILDEPTVGMDLDAIDFFWNYLDHVSGSVLTITHDFNQIDQYFSRVLLLKNGKIAQDVSIDKIHSHNQTIEQWYRHFNATEAQ
ncbi:XRE family transcriptional regulator [Liquorilactobacillus satsumensis]|uniref:XRE-family DNA-binding domain-containing protein n=1 Tax=Liquorilactobacillus satsumensis DSM 16230 = JCM 12392 TaxID=1423801 RepID=A0A0R1V388_9LACO|nr:ATP-binding cassette domain-containing protein [Liquorilactobacillus satsumensis]KRM00033.1 XRE-family DNA-binding domain-containing protein [Liquorilactobacillus satsumensis DSM 16230 = JCM 12392]MCC7666992.1 ABC transporter [Liquorilactobacillus satsumensis]MCP9313596.1 ATP-binding cassette domain-containing protein [Liquorilactobacillus satsumensis]MCP9358168.1 ATP-binding cassette domain-containing protein [Liquorilactobacillus satsumensis]MCP9360738.1 ATP-binding cassette domain-contai